MSSPASLRYHAFDALRAIMMLLGVVLHTATSYSKTPLGDSWPYKDHDTSALFDLVLFVLHSFRMPVFFVMAGFFAALLVDRRGEAAFVSNRLSRILVPFVLAYVFILPPVKWGFHYALGGQEAATVSLFGALERAMAEPYADQIGHLWFLYYLLYFYAASVAVIRVTSEGHRRKSAAAFAWLMQSRLRVPVLGLLLAAPCVAMPFGVLETSMSFVPNPGVLVAYASFYAFGWLLHGWREHLSTLTQGLALRSLLLVVLMVGHLAAVGKSTQLPEGQISGAVVATALTGAMLGWMMVFVWLGAFLRFLDGARPWLRYLTDASYWIYLVHLPIVIFATAFAAPLAAGAFVKAALVASSTAALSLASYTLFVRNTAIGTLLNGRRYPHGVRATPGAVASEA